MAFDIFKFVGSYLKSVSEDAADSTDWNGMVDSLFSTVSTTTTPYTALDTDFTIMMNATAGNKQINLPTAINGASKPRKTYLIFKTDSTANTVTIDAFGGETINGSLTLVLSTQYAWTILRSDGSNWLATTSAGGGGGGTITGATNVGTAGVGIWLDVSGSTIRLKKVNAGSSKITITDDTGNNEVDVDIAEAQLTHNNIGGTLGTTKGGTNLTSYALGDVLWASAVNVLSALAGNTTSVRKFLREVGNGSAVTSLAWDTIQSGDVPDNISVQKVKILKAATLIGTRQNINLIEGTNTTLTVADNAGTDSVDITITSTAAGGSNDWVIQNKSANYTAVWGEAVLVTTGASTITITIPTAVGNSGKHILVKKVDTGAGTVVINTTSSQTIDAKASGTIILYNRWERIKVFSDATNPQEEI